MSWAEFVLRSIAFKEQRKWDMKLTREIAYPIYCNGFLFAKTKPLSKENFWPIDNRKHKSKVSDSHKEAFMKAHAKYLEEVKNKQNG